MNPVLLMSLIIFLPTAGALLLLAFDRKAEEAMRVFTLAVTVVVFLLTVVLLGQFNTADPGIQPVMRGGEVLTLAAGDALPEGAARGVSLPWIERWSIRYQLGYDGISVPLVLLTGFVSVLAMLASWSIRKLTKGYLILFLLLETGMLGVFLSLDFFLFYVFWEVMLLPMYFLIGIWGGPRKEYAAIKFFLYTLVGSVLMLIAILMFYFASANPALGIRPSFDLLRLTEIAQGLHAEDGLSFGQNLQLAAFVLLFVGFAIKVPSFPFHTWLPDAHVEAPTPISMILAGVLLKMGGYGIVRIAFPLCPYGAHYFAWTLVCIGTISIVYGAFAALAQTDFKRLVAYSSVSHMGYVLVGLAVWKIGAGGDSSHWQMGINGALFQMLAHGVSSAGMFFMVGVIYDRVHHRDLNAFGGLAGLMPLYSGLAVGIFFAGLGLPGLCGFIGEVFVTLSAWNYSPVLAIVVASGVILTAGYILWTVQRVFLGAEYRGPHAEEIVPIHAREATVGFILLFFAVLLGVYPRVMLDLMHGSTELFVQNLEIGYRAALGADPASVSSLAP